ncbi:hypothetical protein HPB51_017778 [Rhipicephalus microplus]|uniref:Uncharacterized protein n=1 Tax=Rhipicephalus microplus TaxID=6941 RepID=A0A9J6EB71_RHIMP|nr:hypothetical protein HPB51_017778 [Rhipicephalus microplus]
MHSGNGQCQDAPYPEEVRAWIRTEDLKTQRRAIQWLEEVLAKRRRQGADDPSNGCGGTRASASTGLRPFYVFGPMVNSLEDVDNFMGLGVNAIEADLNFASDGTPQKFYHGWPCGCHRDCEKSAGVITYLSYLRDAVSQSGKFAGKLQLLYVDTKTESLSSGTKYQAGINLANSLINTLWNNGTIPSENMLNVILSVSSTLDKEILSGAFDTIKRAEKSSLFLDHVEFEAALELNSMWLQEFMFEVLEYVLPPDLKRRLTYFLAATAHITDYGTPFCSFAVLNNTSNNVLTEEKALLYRSRSSLFRSSQFPKATPRRQLCLPHYGQSRLLSCQQPPAAQVMEIT